jgi:hypothetical protein
VIPHVGDQPYWADRLRRLGVAPQPQPCVDCGPIAWPRRPSQRCRSSHATTCGRAGQPAREGARSRHGADAIERFGG